METKQKVNFKMCEDETGGFTTGISCTGVFTNSEIEQGKHNELIKDIELIDGCSWYYEITKI